MFGGDTAQGKQHACRPEGSKFGEISPTQPFEGPSADIASDTAASREMVIANQLSLQSAPTDSEKKEAQPVGSMPCSRNCDVLAPLRLFKEDGAGESHGKACCKAPGDAVTGHSGGCPLAPTSQSEIGASLSGRSRQKRGLCDSKKKRPSLPPPPETGTVYCLGGKANIRNKRPSKECPKRLSGMLRRHSFSTPRSQEVGDYDEACKALWTGQPLQSAPSPTCVPSLKELLAPKAEEREPASVADDQPVAELVRVVELLEPNSKSESFDLSTEAAARAEFQVWSECFSHPAVGPEELWDQPVHTFSATASTALHGAGTTAPTVELHQQQKLAGGQSSKKLAFGERTAQLESRPELLSTPPWMQDTCLTICKAEHKPPQDSAGEAVHDITFAGKPAVHAITHGAGERPARVSQPPVARTATSLPTQQMLEPSPAQVQALGEATTAAPATPLWLQDDCFSPYEDPVEKRDPPESASSPERIGSPSWSKGIGKHLHELHCSSSPRQAPPAVRRGRASSKPPTALFAVLSPMTQPTQGQSTGLVWPTSQAHLHTSTADEVAGEVPTPCRASGKSRLSSTPPPMQAGRSSDRARGAQADSEKALQRGSPPEVEISSPTESEVSKDAPSSGGVQPSANGCETVMSSHHDPSQFVGSHGLQSGSQSAAALPGCPPLIGHKPVKTQFLQHGLPPAGHRDDEQTSAVDFADSGSDADDPTDLDNRRLGDAAACIGRTQTAEQQSTPWALAQQHVGLQRVTSRVSTVPPDAAELCEVTSPPVPHIVVNTHPLSDPSAADGLSIVDRSLQTCSTPARAQSQEVIAPQDDCSAKISGPMQSKGSDVCTLDDASRTWKAEGALPCRPVDQSCMHKATKSVGESDNVDLAEERCGEGASGDLGLVCFGQEQGFEGELVVEKPGKSAALRATKKLGEVGFLQTEQQEQAEEVECAEAEEPAKMAKLEEVRDLEDSEESEESAKPEELEEPAQLEERAQPLGRAELEEQTEPEERVELELREVEEREEQKQGEQEQEEQEGPAAVGQSYSPAVASRSMYGCTLSSTRSPKCMVSGNTSYTLQGTQRYSLPEAEVVGSNGAMASNQRPNFGVCQQFATDEPSASDSDVPLVAPWGQEAGVAVQTRAHRDSSRAPAVPSKRHLGIAGTPAAAGVPSDIGGRSSSAEAPPEIDPPSPRLGSPSLGSGGVPEVSPSSRRGGTPLKAVTSSVASHAPTVPLEACRGVVGTPAARAPRSASSCGQGSGRGSSSSTEGPSQASPLSPGLGSPGLSKMCEVPAIPLKEGCSKVTKTPKANPQSCSPSSCCNPGQRDLLQEQAAQCSSRNVLLPASRSHLGVMDSTGLCKDDATTLSLPADDAVVLGECLVECGFSDRAASCCNHSPGSRWQRPLPADLGGPAALDPIASAPADVPSVERGAVILQVPMTHCNWPNTESAPAESPSLRCMPRRTDGITPEEPGTEQPSPGLQALCPETHCQSRVVLVGTALLGDPPPEPRAEPVGREAAEVPGPAKRRRRADSVSSVPHAAQAPLAAAGKTGQHLFKTKREHIATEGKALDRELAEARGNPTSKRQCTTVKASKADSAFHSQELRPALEPEPEEPEHEPPLAQNIVQSTSKDVVVKSEPKGPAPGGRGRGGGGRQQEGGAKFQELACRDMCFATTGLELSGRQKRILFDLGAKVADEWTPEITHLVADTFRRTAKMMCAICHGAYVVTPEYIVACRAAGQRVDEMPFMLQDTVCEAAFARKRGIANGYSLAAALERARSRGPLLRGISVYCFPSVIEKRELPMLVAAAGGTWLTRFPSAPDNDTVLLLAERMVSGEKEQQRRRAHAVFDVELLREAACTQEIRKAAYRLR